MSRNLYIFIKHYHNKVSDISIIVRNELEQTF
jgi:hypothetical protein